MGKTEAIAFDEASSGDPKESAHQALLDDALTFATVMASTSPVDAGLKILVSELANRESSSSLSEMFESRNRGELPSGGKRSFLNLFKTPPPREESSTTMAAIAGAIKPSDLGSPKTYADFIRERDIARADILRSIRREAALGGNPNKHTPDSKPIDGISAERKDFSDEKMQDRRNALDLKLPNERATTKFNYDNVFKSDNLDSNRVDTMTEQFRKGLKFLNPTAYGIQSMSSMISDVFKPVEDQAPPDDAFFKNRLLHGKAR